MCTERFWKAVESCKNSGNAAMPSVDPRISARTRDVDMFVRH